MKPYWDSSALVQTTSDLELETRLHQEGGYTRSHTLTEVFSALTGKMHIRLEARAAAKAVRAMAARLQFVNLSEEEILDALDKAQARGIRGGRVHDYVHALAAAKAKAGALLTADRNDFENLVPGVTVEQV
jgi:predicted nucleic acid-binding protein